MDDLISRQAAIEETWRESSYIDPLNVLTEIRDRLSALPSADVVEVVRCKDCKHYVIHTLFGHRQGWCERLCDEHDKSLARGTEEYDFCSRAEERKDG